MVKRYFFQKASICLTCSVYFKPYNEHDREFENYCPKHREPLLEKARTLRAFRRWCDANFEKLNPRRLEEERLARVEQAKMTNAGLQAMAQQQAAMNSYNMQYNNLASGSP